jgi:hypothetical protein
VTLSFFGKFILPTFSKNNSNKIGKEIDVVGTHSLRKQDCTGWDGAVADEPIDATVDAETIFCVRVDNGGSRYEMMIGFTSIDHFDFWKCFAGQGASGSREIVVILSVRNDGAKREIRFLCDGKESEVKDVSETLKGDFLYPAVGLGNRRQQITTIPFNQINLQRNSELLIHFQLGMIFLQQREILLRELKEKMQLELLADL